ncbi:MAG: aromatic ring-hydroxylating dioxygenase subunit alpha [Gemmatimonadetes bacterium]|nr:aromatic ring-hydroxylating dioxygenase subunit alpha [Gemmatimonadota bacterium]
MTFSIDPDIRKASTPPSRVYTDRDIYESALERIFARTWQWVGHDEIARVPGSVHPFTLLDGSLAEPLLLTRDRSDVLRCLSNVCTHRGNLVCESPGIEAALRCRYHGRRFGLDGSFQSMPEFEETADFPTESDSLPELALEREGPFLFTSLSPAHTFDDWMEPVRARVGWLPLDEFRYDATRAREYLVDANWALYCENYLEGFHIPFVHASLGAALDYGSYRTELFPHGSLQLGVAKGGESTFALPADSPDHGTAIAGYYFWLFPNIMLNFYPWGLSVNVVKPLGVGRTRVSFLPYVWKPELLSEGAGADLDRVEREDEAIVEAVQRGVRSRLYERGRYSPTRETGTHHFHRMLASFLA